MKITFEMLIPYSELATQKNFDKANKKKDCYLRCKMVEANHKLATQDNYKKEEDYSVRRKMVKANPKLATIENFKKANKKEDWYLRCEMLKANKNLATLKNFNDETDGIVRRVMQRLNPALQSN